MLLHGSSAGQYLDLFDDAIDGSSKQDVRYLRRLTTLRLQAMWAILFYGRLVVPEQWLVSSPALLQVSSEIVQHYPWRYRDDLISPPISGGFYARQHRERMEYPRALMERIKTERPLRLSPDLDLASHENAGALRQRLAAVMEKLHEREYSFAHDRRHIEDECHEILQSGVGLHLVELARYFDQTPKTKFVVDQGKYQASLGTSVIAVKRNLFKESLDDLRDDRVAGFRAFFKEAEKRRVGANDITDLWRLSSELDISIEAKQLIENVGRYVMHQALSDACGASHGAFAAHTMARAENDDLFDFLVRQFNLDVDRRAPLERDFQQVIVEQSANYRFAERLKWDHIWSGVWAFALSDRWQRLRKQALDRMGKLPLQRKYDGDEFNYFFDHVLAGSRQLALERQDRGDGWLSIAVNTAENTNAFGKVGKSLLEPLQKAMGMKVEDSSLVLLSPEILSGAFETGEATTKIMKLIPSALRLKGARLTMQCVTQIAERLRGSGSGNRAAAG